MAGNAAEAVLQFWFGDAPLAPRKAWFAKDAGFDREIEVRFGPLVAQVLRGGPVGWPSTARGQLARILALDQFPRNIHRHSAMAFAGDALARQAALAMIGRGEDQALAPLERVFAYLPLEHAEDAVLQQASVSHFRALSQAHPELSDYLRYALRHQAVIDRFGRFPHRNALLGRESSAGELAFLAQPGSGF